ncbi:MAG: ferrous iron transport protein B [Dictyoglomus sp.]|nr:ferrous iron transport protein B [Dictyoglomus sp.]MCX7942331.1 ferrous iron transport protein B [Dictyoglomaceae bacterium]MDW8188636.1 ferrous iron transport protein B [Dictyoglomus sp.]
MEKKKIRVALCGNPNVGKSTIFNLLTGLRQHTGNWPGKTVEKKEGIHIKDNYVLEIIDLPGTYSLTSRSVEEIIARDFIIKEKPDIIVVIADASSLERNLYLLSQILELYSQVILALNMIDLLSEKKYRVDFKKLEEKLGIPVIPMIANKGIGIEELVDKIIKIFEGQQKYLPQKVDYGDLEEIIGRIEEKLPKDLHGYNSRFIAIKLLEGDEIAKNLVRENISYDEIEKLIGKREDTGIILANARYDWIKRILSYTLEKPKTPVITISDQLDYWFTHPIFGLPISLIALGLVFWLTYTLNDLFIGPWENFINLIYNLLEKIFFFLPSFWKELLLNGVWEGISILLNFIPLIIIFFFFFAVLEDTGYLARVAFVTDRIMHILGLHGKAFLPLIMSYGCNVPGIMGGRTIEEEKDRILLTLLNPFIPCVPRIIVSAFFASIFFPKYAGFILLSLYVISLIAVFISGKIIRKFLLKTSFSPLIMELPLYKFPNPRTIGIYIWEKLKAFLQRAGTIMVFLSAIVWILGNFPSNNMENSLLAYIGRIFLPFLSPLGFNWQLVVGLIAGFVAKEASLTTLSTIYHATEENLRTILLSEVTPLTAYCFMILQLLYIPCAATIATIYKETNSKKWTLFSIIYSLVFSYIFTFLIYNLGKILFL